jgi:hypothetical protein
VGGKGGVGAGGEMNQALYAHMNNKTIIKKEQCQLKPLLEEEETSPLSLRRFHQDLVGWKPTPSIID